MAQGSALDDVCPDLSQVVRYGYDAGLLCVSYTAITLWLLGFPERALQCIQRVVTRAHHHPHPLSQVIALILTACVAQCRREPQATQGYAEAAIALAREHGLPFWAGPGTLLQGWTLAEHGQHSAGIALLRQGLAAYQATENKLNMVYFLTLLVEGSLRSGQADDGLTLVAETLAARSPGYFYQGELQRLKGELLLQSQGGASAPLRAAGSVPHADEAETCFHQALAVARRLGAKSLELRAALSLSRLWQRQGKPHAARQLLAATYGWFTEGFDTADVREARELLEELGGMP